MKKKTYIGYVNKNWHKSICWEPCDCGYKDVHYIFCFGNIDKERIIAAKVSSIRKIKITIEEVK